MIPTIPIETIWLRRDARFDVFCQYARYIKDAPKDVCYAIKLQGKLVCSGDTYELNQKFEAWVRRAKFGRTRRIAA